MADLRGIRFTVQDCVQNPRYYQQPRNKRLKYVTVSARQMLKHTLFRNKVSFVTAQESDP